MRRELIPVVSFLLLVGLAAGAANDFEVKINFQPSTAQIPEGYLPDYGEVFGDRGNGFRYGWDRDIQGDSRRRGDRWISGTTPWSRCRRAALRRGRSNCPTADTQPLWLAATRPTRIRSMPLTWKAPF